MVVYNNPEIGFTAMQKATSANTAIVAKILSEKLIPPGAYLPENIINKIFGWRFVVSELRSLGFQINITEKPLR